MSSGTYSVIIVNIRLVRGENEIEGEWRTR